MDVTVVGAGVIGLTVAAELTRAGHAVEVIAERVLDATTSAVAGAVWFPYRVGPRDKVAGWAARSRARLCAIAADPAARDAGVDVVVGYECDDGDQRPWWAAALGDEVERAVAPVTGAPPAWRYRAPRIEPARFLPWLAAQLPRPVQVRRIESLDALGGDAVIDCAGLGARVLAGDPSVRALRGQVVVVERGDLPADVSFTDDRGHVRPDGGVEPIFYAIPRRDEVVLGGTSDPVDDDEPPAPDPEVTARILARCRALGWTPGPVRRVRVGLRPYRPEVRLERDADRPRVIHCYGHGGAGFTLAYGCAEAVVELLG
jgi:D-amino-acid oxidase